MAKRFNAYALNANKIHKLAKAAYRRLEETASGELDHGKDDVLVAVLFSAAALESLINELATLSSYRGSARAQFPFLRTLADVLSDAEKTQASVRQKYLLAKHVLPGEPYDRGSQPYQDFDLLFKIRDEVVHPKPEPYGVDPQRITRPLEAKGLIEPIGTVSVTWMTRISTLAVARWACNVVPDMARSLIDCFVENGKLDAKLIHLVLSLDQVRRTDEGDWSPKDLIGKYLPTSTDPAQPHARE